MKSLTDWLCVMFMGLFWIFRIAVAFMASWGTEFPFKPLDMNLEIVLLFIVFLCIILVAKRKLVGAIIYLASYGIYFGADIFNTVIKLNESADVMINYGNLFVSFIGIILPIIVLFSVLLDKNRKAHPTNKKTDWFYKNKQFDRELDERADKNNYRTL